jgi:hypothetical protein
MYLCSDTDNLLKPSKQLRTFHIPTNKPEREKTLSLLVYALTAIAWCCSTKQKICTQFKPPCTSYMESTTKAIVSMEEKQNVVTSAEIPTRLKPFLLGLP